jgi:putative DNA primase/helicase
VPLVIDAEQVAQFYRLLYGDTDVETEVRCIHPDRSKQTFNFWGSLEEPQFAEPFMELNREGYGIYLVVNQPMQAAGRARVLEQKRGLSDEHIESVNALFVEMDEEDEYGANMEKLQEAALPPSILIRSSTEEKLHAYWLVADCPTELFTPLQAQLIAHFGSDPTCKNLSRVMRIPGFWHTKREPIRSEILEADGHLYTLTELCESFELDPTLKLSERTAVELPDDWVPPDDIQDRILKAATRHAAKIAPTGSGRHKTLLWFAMACKENRLEQSVAENLVSRVLAILPRREGGETVPVEEALDVIEWVYAKANAGQPWVKRSDGKVKIAEPEAPPLKTVGELKEVIKGLPKDSGDAMQAAIDAGLWTEIGKLPKTEQGILYHALKKQSGIGLTDSRGFVKDATEREQDEPRTPSDMRDIIIEVWGTQGTHIKYVAEWENWYTYGNGVYKLTLESTIRQRIEDILERHGERLRESVLSDVVAKISRHPSVYLENPPEPCPYLNLKNGLLDIDTLALRKHSPNVMTMAQSETYYDPNARCTAFTAFIERVCPNEENRKTLQEFLGYILSPRAHLQKALYLKGDAGTGKGTLTTTVLNKLLGGVGKNGLVAIMALKALEDDNHSLVGALNKRLIVVSEVGKNDDLLGFKKITVGDPMHINPKNKSPFNATIEAKIIITANSHIFTGVDNANASIDRRLIILPFNVTMRPEDKNPNIGAELTTPAELSGILNWCLEGWERLKANNFLFTNEGDFEQRLEFLAESNHVIDFLRDWYEPKEEGEVQSSVLYERWKDWCLGEVEYIGMNQIPRRTDRGSGHQPGSQKGFANKTLAAAKALGWKVKKERHPETRAMTWYGLDASGG